MNISNDVYNRTTSSKHRECCQLVYRKSREAGDIYLGSYSGWCAALSCRAKRVARILSSPAGQVQRAGGDVCDGDGGCCNRIQGPCVWQPSEADEGVVILLQAVKVRAAALASAPADVPLRFQARLIEHIQSNPKFVQPEARRNDILQRLQREPLLDLSISRTTFDWGIPVPDDPEHVMCDQKFAPPIVLDCR